LQDACENLKNNDIKPFGEKMYATHKGLSLDYEVSCPELDLLVHLARKNPAVLGSRMMGGGFGGCTISLIKEENMEDYILEAKDLYREKFKRDHTKNLWIKNIQIFENKGEIMGCSNPHPHGQI
jgi:galactokinase